MMKKPQTICKVILAVGLFVPLSVLNAQQNSMGGTGTPASPHAPFGPHDSSDTVDALSRSPGTQQQLEKSRQNERQRRLIADTNRLLALATQLRADADKSARDTATVEDVRKIEEIEKLAHNVKERMKY